MTGLRWWQMKADEDGSFWMTRMSRPPWALTASEVNGVMAYSRPIGALTCVESGVEGNVGVVQRDTDSSAFVVINEHRFSGMEAYLLTTLLMEAADLAGVVGASLSVNMVAADWPGWASAVTYPEPEVVEYVRPVGQLMCAEAGREVVVRIVQRELELGAKISLEGLTALRLGTHELRILTSILMSSLRMIKQTV